MKINMDERRGESAQVSVRQGVLDEARKLTSSDRNKSYGEPEDNFGEIAAIWNAQGVRMLASPDVDGTSARYVNATDVALLMAGMKLARLKHNPGHRDSWVDMAGYAACGAQCAGASAPSAMGEVMRNALLASKQGADVTVVLNEGHESVPGVVNHREQQARDLETIKGVDRNLRSAIEDALG